ncbi:MAG: 50S ribosomal protein L10 [Candidatus Aenigmatarchaeota archaeon]
MEKKGRKTVRPDKIKTVEDLTSLMNKYPIIGVLDLCKTPASALQKIKMNLKGRALIRVAKRRMILYAMEKAKKENLKEYIKGYPALILTNEDPFKLFMAIKKQIIPASAKPGDMPEEDIEIKAGPTELMPGPAISTLSKVKIPAKVDKGKIAVMRDFVACKAGQPVSLDLASALQLLKLQPMSVGLNVVVFDERGTVYKAEDMFVDETKLLNDIQMAIQNAFNLSINADYPTKETIGFMLAKAQMEAKALEAELKLDAPKEEKPAEETKTEEVKEEPKAEEAPKEEVKTEDNANQ